LPVRAEQSRMSTAHQIVDILLAGLIAGLVAFPMSVVAPRAATSVGVAAAAAFYFSRHPWGVDEEMGREYNQQLDDLYERYLPF
jgi:ammonia channel protein AmtB